MVVYILAAVELLTFKWLILCEFYLNFLNEKISFIPKGQSRGREQQLEFLASALGRDFWDCF